MNAPVIVFTYNRLDHLKKMLYALEHAKRADRSELYIFADGYKGSQDKEKVLAVQEYLRNYEKESLFGKVTISYREKNRGLAESVIAGVGSIIEKYGRVIVVEDDLVVSEDFLDYMNAALDHYQDNPNAWAVSGWSPNVAEIQALPTDTFLWYRSSSWGWATWLDRWQMIDWSMREYPKFRFSARKRRKLNRGGADMSDMLDMQMQGLINSWAIRFAYAESMNDRLTIFPKESRVVNCGRDGSGTNCHDVGNSSENSTRHDPVSKRVTDNPANQSDLSIGGKEGGWKWGETLPPRKLDRKIYRSFSGTRRHCLKWRIKSILNRMGIKKF